MLAAGWAALAEIRFVGGIHAASRELGAKGLLDQDIEVQITRFKAAKISHQNVNETSSAKHRV